MLKKVMITDGREIVLDDLDQMTPEQGVQLATAIADLLIRAGHIRDDVALSGPHLVQFLSEMADQQSRDTIVVEGEIEVHAYNNGGYHLLVTADAPYDHVVPIDIERTAQQDSESYQDAVNDLTIGRMVVTARKTANGHLVTTTDDIHIA